MGVNNGVKNERALIESLNGKTHSKLNKNLKKFIQALFPGCKNSDVIKCKKQEGNAKGDLKVSIEKNTKSVSVKVGTGLSIHEENFYTFKKEFLDKHNCSSAVKKTLENFIVSGPSASKQVITQDKKTQAQKFLTENKQSLLERFMKNGRTNIHADYIYYGNCNTGCLMEIDEAIKLFSSVTHRGYFQVGGISLQAYCRECGNKTTEQSQRLQAKISTPALNIFNKKNRISYEECDD